MANDILNSISQSVEQTETVTDASRGIIRASSLLRKGVTEIPMLFPPIFNKVGLAVLAGSSDAGKSQLLRNMAISVTLGKEFIGLPYKGEHRSAIFVSSEDDEDGTAFLLIRHQKTIGMSPEAVENLRFIFDAEDVLQHLAEELETEPADLIICDAFSDLFTDGEINSATDTRLFLNRFKEIAQKYKCLVIFLHHISKARETVPPSKNNLVGSESLQALPRLVIELRSDRENPDLKHFCIVKGNYLASKYKSSSYVLKMDENFVFTFTGERVPFDDIISSTKPNKPQNISPENYPKEVHEILLQKVATTPASKEMINNAVADRFKISDKPSRIFTDYYIESGMLVQATKGKYPKYSIPQNKIG